jgi:hypothetical protein
MLRHSVGLDELLLPNGYLGHVYAFTNSTVLT